MNPQLIKTIAEVQLSVPVAMTSDFDKVANFLRSAENAYVLKLIGPDQFEALKTEYDRVPDEGHPADAALQKAIALCQVITSNLGYYAAIPVLAVSVSSSGIQTFSSADTKTAFQWQTEDLKDALQDLGFNGIEELLEHLESDDEKFSEYFDSDQYTEAQTYLIRSAAEFSKYYDIEGSRYVFTRLLSLMKRVEDQTLTRVLGATFYDGLKSAEPEGKYKILVEKYLKPGLALLTASKAFIERVITLKDGKVAFNFRGNYNNIKESQAASRDQLTATCDQLDTDGNDFIAAGLQYIADNQADFEDFVQPAAKRRFKFNNDPAKGIFGV